MATVTGKIFADRHIDLFKLLTELEEITKEKEVFEDIKWKKIYGWAQNNDLDSKIDARIICEIEIGGKQIKFIGGYGTERKPDICVEFKYTWPDNPRA